MLSLCLTNTQTLLFQVVSPVAGTAVSTGSGQVTVTAGRGPFDGKLIILNDILANASLSTAQEVFSGQMIGTVATSACQPNSIHVTVKEKSSSGDFLPIDPTPYLDRIGLPDLKWNQVCDEYKLVFLGLTLVSGRLSEAAKEAVSDIRRGKNPFRGLGGKVKEAVNNAKSKVNEAVDEAKEGLKKVKQEVGRAAGDIKDAFTSDGVENAFKEVFPSPGLDQFEYKGPEFGASASNG